MNLVYLGASWLHSLSVVVLLGYYATLALVVLPALTDVRVAAGPLLVALERRAMPWTLTSIGVVILTGIYLMIVDASYGGLGAIAGSAWGALILVKHLVVAGLVVLGIVIDRMLVPDLMLDGDEAWHAGRLRLLGLGCWGMVGLGAVVLLLTSAAQAA